MCVYMYMNRERYIYKYIAGGGEHLGARAEGGLQGGPSLAQHLAQAQVLPSLSLSIYIYIYI